MNIEIDILNGDASWPAAKPLLEAVWPREAVEKSSWGHIEWARADLRILIEQSERLVCHVGVYFRTVIWKGRKFQIGGIGGVATHPDSRRLGYASIGLDAAIQTLRHHDAIDFALLFCEPHHVAFYEARGWHRFGGETFAEQGGEKVIFDAMASYVFDLKRGPRDGTIDLCGLPW